MLPLFFVSRIIVIELVVTEALTLHEGGQAAILRTEGVAFAVGDSMQDTWHR
jgi:hypothetical protein